MHHSHIHLYHNEARTYIYHRIMKSQSLPNSNLSLNSLRHLDLPFSNSFCLFMVYTHLMNTRINNQRSNYPGYNKPNSPRPTQDLKFRAFSTIALRSKLFPIDINLRKLVLRIIKRIRWNNNFSLKNDEKLSRTCMGHLLSSKNQKAPNKTV